MCQDTGARPLNVEGLCVWKWMPQTQAGRFLGSSGMLCELAKPHAKGNTLCNMEWQLLSQENKTTATFNKKLAV